MTRVGGPASAVEDLASRVAASERAEAGPRRLAQELEVALAAAVAAERFSDAERLKADLHEARAGLAMREAETATLRNGQAAVERERQETERAIQEAERRSRAQAAIGEAVQAERAAQGEIDAALAGMREHLRAAQGAYQAALTRQAAIREARQAELAARIEMGEMDPPGPRVPGENRVSVLADTEPLIRELSRWRP